jgi:hypothetical protein
MKMPTGAELALPAQQVEELIRTMVKGLRAFQMYLPNNPIYQRAQQAIHDAFLPIWSSTQQIVLSIVETDLIWEEQVIYRQPVKSESFAWMLYKDGMRLLTLRPGAEDEEIVSFLQVATRARLLPSEAADDLLTLLWEQEFAFIDYQFTEIISDIGPQLDPQMPASLFDLNSLEHPPNPETQAAIKTDVATRPPGQKELDEFDSTLYFLDEQEIRLLKLQVDQEYSRDTRKASFDALLDTFELQPTAVVRQEVLNIFDGLFPNLLNRGEFRVVAALLREFRTIAERVRVLDATVRERLLSFQARLSDPAILSQLLQSLEEAEAPPPDDDIGQVLGELHAEGLETMLTFLPTLKRAGIRALLEASIDRLGGANLPVVQRLLEQANSPALPGAVTLCGRLRLQALVPYLERLVGHEDAGVRRATVQALGSIGSAGALTALERGLDDPDHHVRLAAVSIVVEKGYRAAIKRLEAVVQGKSRHELERAERRQFFEAFATLGGPEVLATLAEILEPRKLFRRKESSETRTCAAYAIARLQTPEARAVLERISLDKDLPVRNAAIRSLREWRA